VTKSPIKLIPSPAKFNPPSLATRVLTELPTRVADKRTCFELLEPRLSKPKKYVVEAFRGTRIVEFETAWFTRHPLSSGLNIQLSKAPSANSLNWIEEGAPVCVDTVMLTSRLFSFPGKRVTFCGVSDREAELTGIDLRLTTVWADSSGTL
jgi:hypothetical protein